MKSSCWKGKHEKQLFACSICLLLFCPFPVSLPRRPAASRLQSSSLLSTSILSSLTLLDKFHTTSPEIFSHSFCSLSLPFSPLSIPFPKSYPFWPCCSSTFLADIRLCVYPCPNSLKILSFQFSLTSVLSSFSASVTYLLTTKLRKRSHVKKGNLAP